MEQKYIIIIVVVILALCCCSSLIVGITTGVLYGTSDEETETTPDTAAADTAAADTAAADTAAADTAAADKAAVDTAATDTAPVPAPVATSRIYQSYASTDFGGQGDITSKDGDVSTCKTACDQTSGCKGFVTNGTTCWLKNADVKTPTYNTTATYYYTGDAPPGPATAPPVFNPNNQPIKSAADTKMCLDVPKSATTSIYPLQSYPCNGSGAQDWTYKNGALINKTSGMCLDIYGGNTANGTLVGQYPCGSVKNQQWVYNADKTLTSPAAPGKCLDLNGGATQGAALKLWDCSGGNNQQWTL